MPSQINVGFMTLFLRYFCPIACISCALHVFLIC